MVRVAANEILRIGQRLDIVRIEQSGSSASYSSRIKSFENHILVVDKPVRGEGALSIGQAITGRVAVENEVYWFDSVYVGTRREGNLVWLIKMPETLERLQQRAFVRMNVHLTGTMQREDKTMQGKRVLSAAEPLTIKDLHNIGAKLGVEEALSLGQKLYLSFELPCGRAFRIYSEIVRIEPDVHNHYTVGVSFIDLDESARAQLETYILDFQRKSLERRGETFWR